MTTTDHFACAALKYAQGVATGAVCACVYTKQAAQRFIDDLARVGADFEWQYRPDLVHRVCSFVQKLPHTQGKWAAARELVSLEPWQVFILANLFGWVDASGKRRYRYAYIEVPRKNGKSTLLAGIGLYCAFADGEQGAQVYSAATTRDQARIVWEEAQRMTQRLPKMQTALGVRPLQHAIMCERTASTFKPLSRDQGGNQDGLNVHCALVDELHAHKSPEMLDVLESATGAREQPLVVMITTAGFDLYGVCYRERQTVIDILAGKHAHDRMFGIIYTVDEGDDYFLPSTWQKANPNYGLSVNPEMISAAAEKAQLQPSALTNFLTKHLNVWVNSATSWLNMAEWSACADETISADQFKSEPCFIGLDLASKSDLAGKVKVFCRDIDGLLHYYVFSDQYINETTAYMPENKSYIAWHRQGFLHITEGNVTDYAAIEEHLKADYLAFDLKEVAFDPWNAAYIAQRLTAEGLNMVELPQRVQFMSEPMKWLEVLIKQRRIHHNGDPVLTWALSNVDVKPDQNGNIFPRKNDQSKKIDPAVALIMAMARAVHYEQVGGLVDQADADFAEYLGDFVSVKR